MGQDSFNNIARIELARISTSGGDVLRGLKCMTSVLMNLAKLTFRIDLARSKLGNVTKE